MHFMVLILLFLLGVVVWGFFHSNPQGVNRRALLVCNLLVVTIAVLAALGVGNVLYADAAVVKADERGMAVYLGIMAAGTAFLIVMAVGGLLRNVFIFPLSARKPEPPASGA